VKKLVAIAALVLGLATPAHADITVGVFAPSAPFPTTVARVELAAKLAEQVGAAAGQKATGRNYAKASDFAAAVKKGEVTVALVDATYLASQSGYSVIGASVRGGDTSQGWQLVAKGASKVSDLRGKKVLVPSVGGKETDFVLNVLLGGVEKGYFSAIDSASDTASALASLNQGKADAVVCPTGVDLPSGVSQVISLPSLATPVLVTYSGLPAAQKTAIASAVGSFKGDGTLGSFRAADSDGVKAITKRFGVPVKRGPFVVPSVRLLVGDLVEGRKLSIERTPVTTFAEAP
jgi:hypothetical protein